MIVDDSAVIRGLTRRWLNDDPALEVVAAVGDGVHGLRSIESAKPDVVVLDIEMPKMDGMTLLPKLLEIDPTIKVIMASTLTRRNADISFRALAMGAADYVSKPSSNSELFGVTDYQRELIEKVKVLGEARRAQMPGGRKSRARITAASEAAGKPAQIHAISLREPGPLQPYALAIGSSTGGPKALIKLFENLKNSIALPIFITQHMPPMFTAILAENIARASGAPCAEAIDGETVKGGHIYIARGDYHLTVEVNNGDKIIRLDESAPEHFCRPAVDPMLRSLCRAYGPRLLSVILTGMGSDGLLGARALADAGGTLIAQDEASSVVWGMPGAVANDGLCSKVLPIEKIGPAITRVVRGEKP